MSESKPRIAIIGAGIAGLSAAWLLRDRYAVTLYEAQARAGGHADTQLVTLDGEPVAVDMGFIVFNDRNYPNLTGLFNALGVASQTSTMSFGVSSRHGQFEYAGGEAHQLLAQPGNIFKLRFLRMVVDMFRFNRQAPGFLNAASDQTLGEYLVERGYSDGFIEDYILPMGAAIWSASVAGVREFPAKSFIRFFVNHGLLQISGRPEWRTVTGGSKTYVDRLLSDLGSVVRLAAEVRKVKQSAEGVVVEAMQHDMPGSAVYSQVIFACHPDQALALIDDPSPRQAALLSAVRFQDNFAVLHQDTALMPRRKRAWAAWNYLSTGEDHGQAICLTYWMNLLQRLNTRQPLLVSINPNVPIDPAKILRRKLYRHPQFDRAAMQAQEELPEIQGADGLWFAGAWTGWGFHEDGISSAIRVANALGVRAPWQAA